MNDFTKGFWGFFHWDAEFSTELLNFVYSFRFCFQHMKKSKKLFVIVAILFVLATLVVGYDISRRTSFPGSKKLLKESIAPTEEESDSVKVDNEQDKLPNQWVRKSQEKRLM